MKEIHARLTDKPVKWAQQGEHDAVALMVDASEFLRLWPHGVPEASYTRPDGVAYPVSCDLVDGHVRIVLTLTETAVAGQAELEVQWFDNGTEAKSAIYKGQIVASMTAGDMPSDPPGENWLGEVREVGVGVEMDRISVTNMRDEVEGLTDQVRDISQGVEADRDATHGFMERAEGAAEESEVSAEESARQAGIAQNNILNGVTDHNASPGAHDDIREDNRRIEAIARGRATAYVFDTYPDMLDWLADPVNIEGLVRGDNLYIRDTGVKDYWWDGDTPQELEAEAPDLTNYYTRAQVDAMMAITMPRSEYDALSSPEAGRVYNVWED